MHQFKVHQLHLQPLSVNDQKISGTQCSSDFSVGGCNGCIFFHLGQQDVCGKTNNYVQLQKGP